MSTIKLTNGLNRADDQIDLGSFYDMVDGISLTSPLTTVTNEMFEQFNNALQNILNDLNLQGNLDDLAKQITSALSSAFGLKLSLKQRSMFINLFSLICNGFKFDLPDLSLLLRRFVFGFTLSLTICNSTYAFSLLYNGHLESQFNTLRNNIDSINLEISYFIDSLPNVVHAQQEYNNASVALDTSTVANAHPDITDDKKNITRLTTEINDLEASRYTVNGLDEDILNESIAVKDKERVKYQLLLEQHYVNIVDVAIKDLVDALKKKKELLELAKANGRTSPQVKRMLFDLEKSKKELKHLQDEKDKLFVNVANDVLDNLNNGATEVDVKSLNGFIEDVTDTPLVHKLKRTNFIHRAGMVYDKTVDSKAHSKKSPSLITSFYDNHKQPELVLSYVDKTYETNKPMYDVIEKKTASPIEWQHVNKSEYSTVLKMFDKLEIGTKDVGLLNKSIVYSTMLVVYAKRKNKLEFAI